MKYRKKPIVIDAEQWKGDISILSKLDIKEYTMIYSPGQVYEDLILKTLEGDMKVSYNDYIIKGINGEFYPCKPDIFEKTYEAV